jgi:AraC-like DNA-binding protein
MRATFYVPARLTGLVTAIWEQQCEEPRRWRILPSGHVELIFRIGPPLDEVTGRRLTTNPTEAFCFLSGLHTGPLRMAFSRFHVMGVQMHPVAVRAIFGLPCAEVRDSAVDGGLVLRDLNRIEDALCGPGDFLSKARWLEEDLLARLEDTPELRTAVRLRRLVTRLSLRPHLGRDVPALTGYSRSHAHRVFTAWLGQSPGDSVRLSRFVAACQLLHAGANRLTDVGVAAGYYDQSHFIRDFRRFSGLAPGEYRRRMTALPGQCPD